MSNTVPGARGTPHILAMHLACCQVLSLVMMEQPVSSHPDDIRDEKTKLLRCIRPVTQDDCILGQYVAGNTQYKGLLQLWF